MISEKTLRSKEILSVINTFWNDEKRNFVGRRFNEIARLSKLKPTPVDRTLKKLMDLKIVNKETIYYYLNQTFPYKFDKARLKFRDKILLDSYDIFDVLEYNNLSIYGVTGFEIDKNILKKLYADINDGLNKLFESKKQAKYKKIEEEYKRNIKILKSKKLQNFFSYRKKKFINWFCKIHSKEEVDKYLFNFNETKDRIKDIKKYPQKKVEAFFFKAYTKDIEKEIEFINDLEETSKDSIIDFFNILLEITNNFNKTITLVAKYGERPHYKNLSWKENVKKSKEK